MDIETATKALVGFQNHFPHGVLWAPFSKPKKSVGSASLTALLDSEFKHNAEAMSAPEDVRTVLNKQLPWHSYVGAIPYLFHRYSKKCTHLSNSLLTCVTV